MLTSRDDPADRVDAESTAYGAHRPRTPGPLELKLRSALDRAPLEPEIAALEVVEVAQEIVEVLKALGPDTLGAQRALAEVVATWATDLLSEPAPDSASH
ncbi:MAG: hypothetical protein AAGN46_04550 [Acidobacteriota bacterium]